MAKVPQEFTDGIKADLDVMLMAQWESGFRDGIDCCVAVLDTISWQLIQSGNDAEGNLLANLSKQIREMKCAD
ncbi:hypothetical protein BNKMLPFJ_00179 [Escherichia phage vB_EcoS-26175IV]|uniref:Uncharacterized protein n=4 Tax=Epseptimavirus TaxID=2732017 RepID=A0A7H0XBU1_9CAUD|nr:hypothetical protein HOT59_gp054 [Salmonella phage S113]EBS3195775.1 hypothetical protein [Salmonella enterica subsp. enterica serovar Virchow]QDK00049.1 hypothetical protein HEDJPLGI_00158 [Escherichia phage vB_EcoS-26175I]QDK00153.1 hypothetical protein EGCEDKNN_00073 [Escherichia phage vB_EcoS-26175II]QDK00326.1 hypothetical protein INCEGHDL_00119 [Escherichia phage vB_EcoS-26175III]QDK00544.1 hypothetical protein BNKMLPFJ_00179 [Escherichia phage vB_EcoS-26175IV]QDK00623.1 hypothetical